MLEQNIFIEQALPGGVLEPLSDGGPRGLPRPYPTRESRRPLLAWPRPMPLDGEPADVVARIDAYDAWLAASAPCPSCC